MSAADCGWPDGEKQRSAAGRGDRDAGDFSRLANGFYGASRSPHPRPRNRGVACGVGDMPGVRGEVKVSGLVIVNVGEYGPACMKVPGGDELDSCHSRNPSLRSAAPPEGDDNVCRDQTRASPWKAGADGSHRSAASVRLASKPVLRTVKRYCASEDLAQNTSRNNPAADARAIQQDGDSVFASLVKADGLRALSISHREAGDKQKITR
ncbi:hypothetical protein NUW54_g12529 [Trametes sanguinea]|uniref:Uncharacterized protein n=1 Tax=Trametes sanguinea TaxID=158606 RepID=A0ACC1MWD6_9APHY|nr:hypothetical protein NUW54_g12529 [Trametes sanguinea]